MTLSQAIQASGLKNGMTISFHHHLRNGDKVMNMVLEEVARMGFRNITVNCSSVMDVHAPLIYTIYV